MQQTIAKEKSLKTTTTKTKSETELTASILKQIQANFKKNSNLLRQKKKGKKCVDFLGKPPFQSDNDS